MSRSWNMLAWCHKLAAQHVSATRNADHAALLHLCTRLYFGSLLGPVWLYVRHAETCNHLKLRLCVAQGPRQQAIPLQAAPDPGAALHDMRVLLAIWTGWPLVTINSSSKPQKPEENEAATELPESACEAQDGRDIAGGIEPAGHSLRRLCMLQLESMQAQSWPPCLAELRAELLEACKQEAIVSKGSECQALFLLRSL